MFVSYVDVHMRQLVGSFFLKKNYGHMGWILLTKMVQQ